MLNTIVYKVYVITTVDSDRTNYISNHLKKNGINFEFFVAPSSDIIENRLVFDTNTNDFSPSISLISSYVSIFEMARLNGYDSIGIIEDDCFFDKDWDRKLNTFIVNLPSVWDILHIGYHPIHDTDSILKNENVYVNTPVEWHHTTHCMLIKNTMYLKYIKLVKDVNYRYPVDYIFNELYKMKKYNCYSPVEKITYQLSERSNELKHNKGNIRFKSFI